MKHTEYRVSPVVYIKHLERLHLTQEEAGEIFGASGRTGQRWVVDGAPFPVVMILSMFKTKKSLLAHALEVSRSNSFQVASRSK